MTSVDAAERSISEFYKNQTIFVTGATGFLGKLLVEKLLRSCPDLKKIYLLVRPKKGTEESQRLKDMFQIEAFEVLRAANPDFEEKISMVPGDLMEPDLGLSRRDRELLVKEVDCVFHVAATVKFNEPIRKAAYINVRATRDVARLAKEMAGLKVLVYVSTAYSNCVEGEIAERIYTPRIDANNLMKVVEALDDKTLDAITPALIGSNPNTYVFTKSIAEHAVASEAGELPLVVFRPSIVLPTFQDPVPGWTDAVFGAIGMALGVALGLIRTALIDSALKADLIPADLVVNGVIAAAWDAGQRRVVGTTPKEPIVYNFVSSSRNPITWGRYQELLEDQGKNYPTQRTMWYCSFRTTNNVMWNKVRVFFLHTIPAHIVDTILFLLGKEPQLVKGYEKIHKFTDVISYFGMREWHWSDENVQKLLKRMSEEDKKTFLVDVESMEWRVMILNMLRGGRRYLLKESEDTIPAAKRKMMYLKVAHYTLVAVCLLLLYKLLATVYGLFT